MPERQTCRDQNGNSRLMPGGNIHDAIEQLCFYDGAAYGIEFGLPKMPLLDGSDRKTYRTMAGDPRLLPGIDLCDAIDRLCKLEEASFGRLVIETAGLNPRVKKHVCRDCNNYRPVTAGTGNCTVYPERDRHGIIKGPFRPVQAARCACPKGFKPK